MVGKTEREKISCSIYRTTRITYSFGIMSKFSILVDEIFDRDWMSLFLSRNEEMRLNDTIFFVNDQYESEL